MIQITQVKVPVEQNTTEHLIKKCSKILHVAIDDITQMRILKESIDARKKPDLYYVYTLGVSVSGNEDKLITSVRNGNVSAYHPKKYHLPQVDSEHNCGNAIPPVVIGAGPAGLFGAYALCLAGMSPILLERGKAVENRQADVLRFWKEGVLVPDSNVQFGEGGAGTFSDGKLNTLVKDKFGRNRFVLDTFVKFGAPENILYENKPHIGTDILMDVVANLRKEILRLGGEVRFGACVTDVLYENGKLIQLEINHTELMNVNVAVLAIGHSARDTFAQLYERNISMLAKEFAVGFRIEHPQLVINQSQYGVEELKHLPPSPYKLATTLDNGRGVYSFCMCPGGYVVNSSSEEQRLVVNGMSYSKRDSNNANSAIVVSVGSDEYDMTDPMAAIAYQRSLEEKAYMHGNGNIPQQLYGDFLAHKVSTGYGAFTSEAKGNTQFADLSSLFSEEINQTFQKGMTIFGHKIQGFDRPDAILSGVESRTSSPIRIVRDDTFQSNIQGLYPCGEGAGYAGGIMSAAMDGLKVAEKIIEQTRG